MIRNSLPVWGYRRDVQGKRPPRATCATPRLLAPLRAIHFGTVRFNDKPEARHKCSPGWERFTTRLDVAKLNMRLLSDSLESGTGSSYGPSRDASTCQSHDWLIRLRPYIRLLRWASERSARAMMRSRAPGALSTRRPLIGRAVAEHSVARCRSDRRAIRSSEASVLRNPLV